MLVTGMFYLVEQMQPHFSSRFNDRTKGEKKYKAPSAGKTLEREKTNTA